jgi:hypothetical protein
MSNRASFYTLQNGDTLSKIAKIHGSSVSELCKINGIKNPNKITIGQRIALRAEAVCKVTVQLLDRDRNPLRGARVRLEYCGTVKEVSSGKNGRLPDILTETPEDIIKIFIARPDGSWKKISTIVSGWGNKLVTLTSPLIKIEAETKAHPKDKAGNPKQDSQPPNSKDAHAPDQPKVSEAHGRLQNTYGDGKGVKAREVETKDGLPSTKVSNDQAALDFLSLFTGEKISDMDFEVAAKSLFCEIAVIKAVATVESGGRSGFDRFNRPIILYERHKFSKHSQHKYDQDNPDISWPIGYVTQNQIKNGGAKIEKKIAKFVDGKIHPYDYYNGDDSYKRLSKAYALDKTAALKACSWGMFQILGEHAEKLGYKDVYDFVQSIAKSEKYHLEAFVRYINSVPLCREGLKTKNWRKIAEGYNGADYEQFDYHKKLEKIYNSLSLRK